MTNPRAILSALLASALVLAGSGSASADGSAFVGGLLGGAIGSAIVNQQQQRRVVVEKHYVAPRSTRPATSSWQREENRRVQTALNYFGFPAGTPDGVIGRNSRGAIAQYQAYLGYPPTGVLTDYERSFLTSSYDRAVVGGSQTAQIIAQQGQGSRGLLLAYRQELAGITATPAAPAPAAPQPVEVAAPEPTPAPAPVEPEVNVVAASAGAAAGLPSFMPGAPGASMASFCNRVNMTTSANGGFVSPVAMTDPQQALGEQFCIARTYAVEQGESLAGTVQGFSMAEIEEQCEAFAPTMTGYQSRLVSQSPEEATAALQDFVVSTGAPPAQLSGNARICLAVGYSGDNAELALASAMVLVGLGEEAYGELLGYHLLNGFATPKRPDHGLEWLGKTAAALDAGASPLVINGAEGRAGLLRQAVLSIGGSPADPVLQDAAAAPAGSALFVLPQATSN